MIVYHGSIKKFDQFQKETVHQHFFDEIDTVGFWFTSSMHSAKPFAIGTENVIEKSETEFWDDGSPKVVQYEKPVSGFIYKVYIDEPNLKIYESLTEDAYELFMKERDQYCIYLGSQKRNVTWKDKAVLLNKEEANEAFRKSLIKQGYEGILIRNTMLPAGMTDLCCIFSKDSLHIAAIISVEEING